MSTPRDFLQNIQYQFISEGYEEDIMKLYLEAGWMAGYENITREDIRRIIQGSFAFLIVVKDGKAIAMGRILSDGYSDAYIQDVTVRKEFRGHGIGTAVMTRLAEHLTSLDIDWIGLIAQPGTRKFYEKLGFQVMQDHYPMKRKSDG